MNLPAEISPPLLFSPLKHHLGYLKEFASAYSGIYSAGNSDEMLLREIRHLGGSVTDVYSGTLGLTDISGQAIAFLNNTAIVGKEEFGNWCGKDCSSYKCITLSDGSDWVLKYHENEKRYVHLFPARNSAHTFRIKANTLKTALCYSIISADNPVSEEMINTARELAGLTPVKDILEAEAITEMIDMLTQ